MRPRGGPRGSAKSWSPRGRRSPRPGPPDPCRSWAGRRRPGCRRCLHRRARSAGLRRHTDGAFRGSGSRPRSRAAAAVPLLAGEGPRPACAPPFRPAARPRRSRASPRRSRVVLPGAPGRTPCCRPPGPWQHRSPPRSAEAGDCCARRRAARAERASPRRGCSRSPGSRRTLPRSDPGPSASRAFAPAQ